MKRLYLSRLLWLLLGVLLVLTMAMTHVGGVVYSFSMNEDGTIGAVIDSRTSVVRVLDLERGTVTQEIRVFKESERRLKNYRP